MLNIFWLRNDFRIKDNLALKKAVEYTSQSNGELLILFHINDEQIKIGEFSTDYFLSALKVFVDNLKNEGIKIRFIEGNIEGVFDIIFKSLKNIDSIFFNISERGYGRQRDKKISDIASKNKIQVRKYNSKHIHPAEAITKDNGDYYKVYTHYYNKWIKNETRKVCDLSLNDIKKVVSNDFEKNITGDLLECIERGVELYNNLIAKRKTDFCSECGEEIAYKKLIDFTRYKIDEYHINRDFCHLNGTSDLSKHLAAGEISAITIISEVKKSNASEGKETYIKELAWRDFYNMIYYYNHNQKNMELIEKYRDIKWNDDSEMLEAWKEGKTGYPIVDAAMICLKNTGKMHNRLRMIVASFLVKDLHIDWREGEKYFSEMLIDYDTASNIGGWQWSASVGTDACPYFRVFNPITQSEKFDKEGIFIKKYIPQLRNIDKKNIHFPYKYDKEIYIKPIVDHKEERVKAIQMFEGLPKEK